MHKERDCSGTTSTLDSKIIARKSYFAKTYSIFSVPLFNFNGWTFQNLNQYLKKRKKKRNIELCFGIFIHGSQRCTIFNFPHNLRTLFLQHYGSELMFCSVVPFDGMWKIKYTILNLLKDIWYSDTLGEYNRWRWIAETCYVLCSVHIVNFGIYWG